MQLKKTRLLQPQALMQKECNLQCNIHKVDYRCTANRSLIVVTSFGTWGILMKFVFIYVYKAKSCVCVKVSSVVNQRLPLSICT